MLRGKRGGNVRRGTRRLWAYTGGNDVGPLCEYYWGSDRLVLARMPGIRDVS